MADLVSRNCKTQGEHKGCWGIGVSLSGLAHPREKGEGEGREAGEDENDTLLCKGVLLYYTHSLPLVCRGVGVRSEEDMEEGQGSRV